MAINTEIERRFLVDGRGDKPWRECHSKVNIKQFYLDSAALEINQQSISYSGFELVKITPEEHGILVSENNWTSRIRMADEDTILTMKGKRLHASATELEWKISSMPSMHNLEQLPHVVKTRYNKISNDWLNGISIKWNRSTRHSYRFTFISTDLAGNDFNSSDPRRIERGYDFRTPLKEFSLGMDFTMLDFDLHEPYNIFTPYISTGIIHSKFKKQVFFVLNPDTLWRKEYKKEFKNLIKIYRKNKKPALLLIPKSKSFDKSFKGDFNLNSRKQVLRQKNNKLIFTGAQILTRSAFKSKKIKPFSMNKVWDNLIKNKELVGILSKQKFLHINNYKIYRKLIKY